MDEESQHVPSNYNVGFLATTEELSIIGSDEGDDGAESDFSLDYEYLGPRKPNYRNEQDADSDASELSISSSSTSECFQQQEQGFDMWDEDPYSTNDFTWESNDMRLTGFIKERQKHLMKINSIASWSKSASFWRKEKGWPKQLSSSCSTTNHDQSASALSLVLSDYGLSEKLHAVYRDRIVDCGYTANTSTDDVNDSDNACILTETKNTLCNTKINITTIDHDDTMNNGSSIQQQQPSSSSKKFNETHASISLPKLAQKQKQLKTTTSSNVNNSTNNNFISKFTPYTKFIRRSQYPVIFPQDAYLALGFEPLCLAEKYGYMAIGGVEGEFELYCCMNQNKPIKIWGTKFKGKNNVLLMTNAVQIVRWKIGNSSSSSSSDDEIDKNQQYEYFLIACMNDAGVLVYNLPNHNQCHATTASCHLYCHLKCFDHVPINDARVSPDGQHLICVGDDACIFHLSVLFDQQKHRLVFGTPQKIKIPFTVLLSSSDSLTFSSQYVAWSKSSLFFAHTSDTHRTVLVWRTSPKVEMLYRIDAGGYTYAIQFHPEIEGVLAFSNRYGYIHTVNLDEAITMENPKCQFRVADFNKQITNRNFCVQNCQSNSTSPIHHTIHIFARHEITMVSFRGEKNKRLRILAKINGLQWSRDGCYLYVSTKKRVLAYEFMHSSSHVKSLEKLAGLKALSLLEKEQQSTTSPTTSSKRQKKAHSSSWIIAEKKRRKLWSDRWSAIPAHVRHNVLHDTQLASHCG
ncbi:unnamed protein product [Mucor hiemalis]